MRPARSWPEPGHGHDHALPGFPESSEAHTEDIAASSLLVRPLGGLGDFQAERTAPGSGIVVLISLPMWSGNLIIRHKVDGHAHLSCPSLLGIQRSWRISSVQ